MPGSITICSSSIPAASAASIRSANQPFRWSIGSSKAGGSRSSRGGPSMCIRTKPQPRSAASSNRAGSRAPLMSLIATAPASSPASATSAEKVSAEMGRPVRSASPAMAGASWARSSAGGTGGPLRAATAPTSSMSNPASARATPSATARSGVPLRAPENIESTVTLTIPAPSGRSSSRVRPVSRQVEAMGQR